MSTLFFPSMSADEVKDLKTAELHYCSGCGKLAACPVNKPDTRVLRPEETKPGAKDKAWSKLGKMLQ